MMLIKGMILFYYLASAKTQQDKARLNYLEEDNAETNCVRRLNRGHQTMR